MEPTLDHYFETNKSLWNKRTPVHMASDFYDLEGFKNGRNVLSETELKELPDVAGKSMLHLQCHFGLDSLSWARLGADVTGVDFSEEAITKAKEIASETGLKATFICSNIYDLKKHLTGQFDIVFTSYGTICWLPDLEKWAKIIAHFLKPGGTFYIVDFHPAWYMFNFETLKLEYSYFLTSEPIVEEYSSTYTGDKGPEKHLEYSWNHHLSEIISALLNQGLELQHFHEFDFASYNCFPNMVKVGERRWQIAGYENKLPLMYSVKAKKNDLKGLNF